MGISINSAPPPSDMSRSHYRTHKVFLLCNYILLGAASSCIFLTLSLRLLPSLSGFFFILLHVFTILGAVSGCATASALHGSGRWYGGHMVATVLASIFQGAVAVLIFTRTSGFLEELKSYVMEENGVVIVSMVGGLCVVIFCLEWVVLGLAFALRYYACVEGERLGGSNAMKRSAKVQEEEHANGWPWPFQV